MNSLTDDFLQSYVVSFISKQQQNKSINYALKFI